jgi:hypothetical protein
MWAIWPITAPARPCSCCMGFMLRARMAHPRPWLASATAPMPSPQLSWRWRHSTRARPLCQSAAPVCYQATRIVAPLGSGRVTGCMRRLTRQCELGPGVWTGLKRLHGSATTPAGPPWAARGRRAVLGGASCRDPGPGRIRRPGLAQARLRRPTQCWRGHGGRGWAAPRGRAVRGGCRSGRESTGPNSRDGRILGMASSTRVVDLWSTTFVDLRCPH